MKSSNATKIGHTVWVLAGLMLGGLFGKAGTSLAVEHTWTQKADMPTARVGPSTSVVGGKIYVFGGTISEGITSEPDLMMVWPVEVYDPNSDSWTTKSDMPTAWALFSTSAVDGKIYVVGGAESPEVMISMVQEYDPATDTWTRKADLPEPRCYHAASVVDGKIYVIGGLLSLDNVSGLRTVEEYDPVTDTWTRKANMPFGVWGLCTTVVDGKIYALGGRPEWQARPYIQEYDPATDIWARKSDMPVATSQMSSVVLGDKIIVIGGWLHSGNYPYTAVQMYDPETDIWTIERDAPFLRAVFSASVVNNRIYAIGGTDRPHPCPATSTVYELTVSESPPDFNGDGVVDINDLVRLIESWGQDDPLADIAPALGDGVIDVLDLEFLMGYWGQKIEDPTLLAHWPLDETEGDIAYDSAADRDGTLIGGPAWQPIGGIVDGALEFDGIDDYVSTSFVLNPADGAFSVFAWIKGGAPGQVIFSPANGRKWLSAKTATGVLMTELIPSLTVKSLSSDAVITDGEWHCVGLTWDCSSNLVLYVDGVEVASNTQSGIPSSSGGLYIGTGKGMELGTFWSGLIDDIRIYNRVVKP